MSFFQQSTRLSRQLVSSFRNFAGVLEFRASAAIGLERTLDANLFMVKRNFAGAGVPVKPPMYQPLGIPPQGTDPEEVRNKWQSDAMDLINKVEVIKVKGKLAACDGGGGPLGHPIEYIKLDTPFPGVCKYCGLRYASEGGHDGHH